MLKSIFFFVFTALVLLPFHVFGGETDERILEQNVRDMMMEYPSGAERDLRLKALLSLLELVDSQDENALCDKYYREDITPSIVFSLPRLVFSSQQVRHDWISVVPEPNDPAFVYLHAGAFGGTPACSAMFLELYSVKDGYFGEYAGELIYNFLAKTLQNNDGFPTTQNLMIAMSQDLQFYSTNEKVSGLLQHVEAMSPSPFRTDIMNMLRSALEEK